MANITVVDFSGNPNAQSIEHIRFDHTSDYLVVESNTVVIRSDDEYDKSEKSLVRIDDIDNLIKALQYIKEKHA